VLGIALGIVANATVGDRAELAWVIANLTEPAGRIFIRLLLMLVAPLLYA
jgi:DAACS family dicarboxylate/amino acid:cation (Na+ or H+) symporter